MAIDLGFAAPDTLFDLAAFAHRDLFAGATAAWEALGDRLTAYIDAAIAPDLQGTIEDGAIVRGPVALGPGAVIEAGAFVQGPAIFGPRTHVRHGAYVRGYVLTGSDCIIGHSTEVKNAVFLDRASAGHFNYVGDSVLGTRVNLGAGVKLANFRVLPGNVNVRGPAGERIETGLLKLGALLGDDVAIGCNAVTAPGTVIGRGSSVYSLASIHGTLAPRTVFACRSELIPRAVQDAGDA